MDTFTRLSIFEDFSAGFKEKETLLLATQLLFVLKDQTGKVNKNSFL